MKRRLLFVITADPRTSPRPAEAIRIAAGVSSWKKAEVLLYLRENAVRCLTEFPEDLVDSDNFTRYLPLLAEETKHPVYVQKGAPALAEIGRPPVGVCEIDDAQLAEMAARSQYLTRFT
jgi:hypothetical protein